MKSQKEIHDIIQNATGTECYHKFSQVPNAPVITDGVLALAEAAGCYWFLDVIASYQSDKKLDKDFQVWELNVNIKESSAIVQGFNDTTLIITQEILHTDFPIEQIQLFLMDGIILLPSEY